MTFNTKELSRNRYVYIWRVLNLVINGWPSILATINDYVAKYYGVLNLVINGWPSIHQVVRLGKSHQISEF